MGICCALCGYYYCLPQISPRSGVHIPNRWNKRRAKPDAARPARIRFLPVLRNSGHSHAYRPQASAASAPCIEYNEDIPLPRYHTPTLYASARMGRTRYPPSRCSHHYRSWIVRRAPLRDATPETFSDSLPGNSGVPCHGSCILSASFDLHVDSSRGC